MLTDILQGTKNMNDLHRKATPEEFRSVVTGCVLVLLTTAALVLLLVGVV